MLLSALFLLVAESSLDVLHLDLLTGGEVTIQQGQLVGQTVSRHFVIADAGIELAVGVSGQQVLIDVQSETVDVQRAGVGAVEVHGGRSTTEDDVHLTAVLVGVVLLQLLSLGQGGLSGLAGFGGSAGAGSSGGAGAGSGSAGAGSGGAGGSLIATASNQ